MRFAIIILLAFSCNVAYARQAGVVDSSIVSGDSTSQQRTRIVHQSSGSLLGATIFFGYKHNYFITRNIDLHAAAGLVYPSFSFGASYHFLRKSVMPRWHLFAGADVVFNSMIGTYYYLPAGVQYIPRNNFTLGLEVGAVLVRYGNKTNAGVIPGISLGYTFWKKQRVQEKSKPAAIDDGVKKLLDSLKVYMDIKAYAGVVDLPGLAIETSFTDRLAIELGVSYWQRKSYTDQLTGYRFTDSHRLINGSIRFYNAKKRPAAGWFCGLYFRWLQRENSSTDRYQTATQRMYTDTTSSPVLVAQELRKASFGILGGYKYVIGRSFIIGTTLGAGFAPYFSDRNVYKSHTYESGGSEIFGFVDRLSLVGTVSVGYRIRIKDTRPGY